MWILGSYVDRIAIVSFVVESIKRTGFHGIWRKPVVVKVQFNPVAGAVKGSSGLVFIAQFPVEGNVTWDVVVDR